jgi:WD40 repeat protein
VTNAPQIWDARSGRPFGQPLRHHAPVREVAFSPDGKTFVTLCTDETWWSWDLSSSQPVGPRSRTEADALALLALALPEGPPGYVDACRLSGGVDARLRDLPARQTIRSKASDSPFIAVETLSPDGKTVVTAAGSAGDYGRSGEARLWDASTAKPIGSPLKHTSTVGLARFSPDGRTILTQENGGDFTARLWDAATTKPVGLALPHRDDVETMAFGLDGISILTSSADKFARLWAFSTGQPVGLPLRDVRDAQGGAAFVPGGERVLTVTSDGVTRLWDSASGAPLDQEVPIRFSGTSFGGTGLLAFSQDG